MKEIYEKYELHAVEPTKTEFEKTSHSYETIYKRFLPEKGAKILDIGCGYGYFLYFLKKFDYNNFLGIDLSKEEINFCMNNITKKVAVEDAFKFLKTNKEYDLIVINHLLEHIEKTDLISLLRLCYNSLNKEGQLLIQVPNTSNPFSLYSRYVDITHNIGFTDSSLKEVIKTAGFTDIKIFGVLPCGSKKGRIRNVISRLAYLIMKILFILQGYGAPEYLEPKLIAVAKK